MNRLPGRRIRHRSAAGFTMVEVIVAALITLVGLLSVTQLFLMAALYNKSSKQATLATMLAQRKLEQLLALPLNHASLQYNGSLDVNNLPVSGTTENYYLDHTRTGYTGTGQISPTPFYTGQQPSYTVTWVVLADAASPPMSGLRRIIVRAEATHAGMEGNGINASLVAREVAQIGTIRTPPQ
ncbi:MAG: prepilin-type N-terminal cleavage/methylation domain-containing protein [Blastocatellia bacterium]